MSKNTCRMIGLLTMLVSVFLLIGGLYMGPAGVPALVPRLCLIAGLRCWSSASSSTAS